MEQTLSKIKIKILQEFFCLLVVVNLFKNNHDAVRVINTDNDFGSLS